ncbi:hypothetical protein EDB82DRAFT_502323, partial [Fusarium venenatum]|uniref:uncharacterized protein n=1 Tax=Fusarium venenatum TaxID=56646 RepID=UPI001D664945
MQEKGLLYPDDKKEIECLKHDPSIRDHHKIEPEYTPSRQKTLNTSPNTATYSKRKRLIGLIFHALLRILQCIFAVVVAILYGLDLQEATKGNVRAHPSWVFAEVVAGLSMIICIMQWIFMTAVWYWCFLDALISVLWLAQFGVFASMYLGAEIKEVLVPTSIDRMQAAVWVNLVCVVLWFAATVYGAIGCCARFKRSRRNKKHTGSGLMVDEEQAASHEVRV